MNTKFLKHGAAILSIGLLLFFVGFFLVVFAGWWFGYAHGGLVVACGFILGGMLSSMGVVAYIQECYA